MRKIPGLRKLTSGASRAQEQQVLASEAKATLDWETNTQLVIKTSGNTTRMLIRGHKKLILVAMAVSMQSDSPSQVKPMSEQVKAEPFQTIRITKISGNMIQI